VLGHEPGGVIFAAPAKHVGVHEGIAHRPIDRHRAEAELVDDGARAFPIGLMRPAENGALAAFRHCLQQFRIGDLHAVPDDLVDMEKLADDAADIVPDGQRQLVALFLSHLGKGGGEIAHKPGVALPGTRAKLRHQRAGYI
jgi:hypothetical protein